MIRRPPRSTLSSSSAASDVYKRQEQPFQYATVNASDVASSWRNDRKAARKWSACSEALNVEYLLAPAGFPSWNPSENLFGLPHPGKKKGRSRSPAHPLGCD